MSKSLKILIAIVLSIVVLWGIIFGIDYFRCANAKMPIFVVAGETADDGGSGTYYGLGYKVEVKKNISVGYGELIEKVEMYMFDKCIMGAIVCIDIYYAEEPVTEIEQLPENYNWLQAIDDNCVVMPNNKNIYNKDELDVFIEKVKNNEPDFIRTINFTTEGDMLITDVKFEGNDVFSVCLDWTRDEYSTPQDRIYKYVKFSKMRIEESENITGIYLEKPIEGKIQFAYIGGYLKNFEAINDYKNDYLLKVTPHEKEETQIITTGELGEKYDYDIYCSGDVKIKINEKDTPLAEALLNNEVTMEQIIKQAEKDSENGMIWSDMIKDGGSMIYDYGTYTIKKCKSLDGNRDVYINF